jgi:hypothetical protein
MGVLLGYLINYPLDPSNWVDHLEGWRYGEPAAVFCCLAAGSIRITDRIQAAV